MQNFELTKHQVTEVNFRDNGRQKKGESSFDISGSVLLPKDGKPGKGLRNVCSMHWKNSENRKRMYTFI